MLKKKTLFRKYLLVIMMIVILSFLVLGAMLWVFISNYWENEKRELLTKNAVGISNLVSQNSAVLDNEIIYIGNESLMQSFIDTFSNNINADIFITDLTGKVILCSYGNRDENFEYVVSQDIIDKVITDGQLSATSKLGNIYDHKCFFVSVPVTVNNKVVAVIFTAVNSQYLDTFRGDIFTMFFWATLAAVILSLLAIGFLSYTLVKPMRQMANAAQSFGKGDFSQRVPVASEDEMGQLSIAFNNMADSLSASEDIRRNFIANVSHELKTPMTTISGFVDGILDGTIKPDKQEYYLKIVSHEAKRLSRLVRSMINLSRIDSDTVKLNKSSFDLLSLVINILVSFEKRIDEKNITITGLEKSESILIYGDMDMIYQAVYNIIENAIKFVDENGYIDISTEKYNEKAVFKIRNSGQGIKKAEIERIFDRFYKTDRSRSRDKNGMGLGLYIVKQIIKLHSGTVSVTSKEGVYTEFKLFIPIFENKKI